MWMSYGNNEIPELTIEFPILPYVNYTTSDMGISLLRMNLF